MCQYQLDVCPYPHQDPIAATVLDFSKYSNWKLCDLPRPWGRLSCGNLSIIHPILVTSREHSSQSDAAINPSELPCNGTIHHSYYTNPVPVPGISLSPSEIASDIASFSDMERLSIDHSSDSWPSITTPSAMSDNGTCVDKCEWCTIMLKAISYKSLEVQKNARNKIEAIEEAMDKCLELRALRKMITGKEVELDRLRSNAWVMASSLLSKTEDTKV